MAKITRQTFLQFAVNVNAASDICEFGTPATGSPVYTTNIATLQANSAWTSGWAAETVANNRPFLEDMNATHYVFGYMLAYIFEMGIPEYDSGTTYFTNSIVQYSGTCYQSLQDNNIGNTPAVNSYWKLLIPAVTISGILGAWTSKSWSTIYQAATDGFVVGYTQSGTNNSSFAVYSDSSSSPSAIRVFWTIPNASSSMAFCCPIRKNDYYECITNTGSLSSYVLNFIALGT